MGNAGPGMLSATMLDAERSRNQPAARGVSLYVLRRSRLRLLYTLPAHNGGCCGSLNRPWRPRGILARSRASKAPRRQCRRRRRRRLDRPRHRRGDRIGGLLRATAAGLLRSAARLLLLLMTLDSWQHLRFECSDEITLPNRLAPTA